VIRTFVYKDGNIISGFPKEKIQEYKEKGNLLWIDLEDPEETELELLEDIFSFHELSIEDCIFPSNQPKLDVFDNYLFIVVCGLVNSNEIGEIDIFLGKNFLVSVHERSISSIEEIIVNADKDELLKQGPDFLLHAIIDRTVDKFFFLLDTIDAKIDKAEEDIVGKPSQDVINFLFELKKMIVSLKRTIVSQQAVINQLIKKPIDLISDSVIVYFKDINDHLLRINSTLETFRDATTNILQVCFANMSAQLAQIVKILTLIATFILPLTLITSYYGMNVAIPEFGWGIKGWLVSIGIMFSVVISMFAYFKKKRWL